MAAETGFVPYETLVRFGVIQARLNRVLDNLAALDTRIGETLAELAGGDGEQDGFWEEFERVVAGRVAACR